MLYFTNLDTLILIQPCTRSISAHSIFANLFFNRKFAKKDWVWSVSYTHLDVYKRQRQMQSNCCGEKLCVPAGGAVVSHPMSITSSVAASRIRVFSSSAVSAVGSLCIHPWTDVYKRQIHDWYGRNNLWYHLLRSIVGMSSLPGHWSIVERHLPCSFLFWNHKNWHQPLFQLREPVPSDTMPA